MARTPERQMAINEEVWDRRSEKLRREELKSRVYEKYSLKVPVTKIAEEYDMRPLDIYKLVKEAIKDYAVPKGEEATARLAGYAEAALTSLEPKMSEGNVAAHRAANAWIKTLMELYGIGPSTTVEITNNTVNISAEDLPVMQSLDVFRAQNESIEGELANGSE
jgi:hypothetical protein